MNTLIGKKVISGFLVLIIGYFALCSFATAGELGDGVVGTYQGEIWSGGGVPLPGVTSFSLNNTGQIIGAYEFEYENKIETGELSDCIEKEQKRKLVCKWKDEYGAGVLDIDFSSDFTNFAGHWNFSGFWNIDWFEERYPWNGKR